MSKDVKLDIRLKVKKGFTVTEGNEGTIFYYKFSGGNKSGGGGGLQNKGNNAFEFDRLKLVAEYFTIRFIGGAAGGTYKFVKGAFNNKDGAADLSATNGGDEVIVTDAGNNEGWWEYGVKVEVVEGGETFECDPMISNKILN